MKAELPVSETGDRQDGFDIGTIRRSFAGWPGSAQPVARARYGTQSVVRTRRGNPAVWITSDQRGCRDARLATDVERLRRKPEGGCEKIKAGDLRAGRRLGQAENDMDKEILTVVAKPLVGSCVRGASPPGRLRSSGPGGIVSAEARILQISEAADRAIGAHPGDHAAL